MNRSSHISAHALLLLGTAFAIFPFLWMGWAAINDSSVAFSGGGAAARQFAVTENFSRAFTEAPMARYLLNGVIVCAGILICQIVTALPCAYALAKLPVKGRNLILGGIVLCFAIPFQSVALPIFVGLAQFKLLNTYSALILPFATSALAVMILSQFLRSYPDEVIEAARLDGMSEFSILWRLIVPASWPAVAAFGVFSVTAHWNDLYWPLIAVSDPRYATPPLGVVVFSSNESGDIIGPLMAAGATITLPLIAFFLIAQKRFVQGITMSGLK